MRNVNFAFGVIVLLSFFSFSDICFASGGNTAKDDFAEINLTAGEKKALEKFRRLQKELHPDKNPDQRFLCPGPQVSTNSEGAMLTEAEKKAKEKYMCLWKKAPPAKEVKAVKKSRFYISGGYLQNDMRYKEITKRTGNVLDEDTGKLKGFYAAVGFKSGRYVDFIHGTPFIEGYFQRYDALIMYKGGAGGEPLTFYDEHAEVQRFGVKLGGYHDFSEKVQGVGYLDVGRRIWYRGQNRIIEGAQDYAEKYWWTYFGIGGGINVEILPRFRPGIEVEVMYAPPEFSRMRADLYEGATFDLGMILGADVKLPLKYYALKNLSIDVTPYFTYWEINKSDNTDIGGDSYYEPYSRTRIYGLLAGLTYSF